MGFYNDEKYAEPPEPTLTERLMQALSRMGEQVSDDSVRVGEIPRTTGGRLVDDVSSIPSRIVGQNGVNQIGQIIERLEEQAAENRARKQRMSIDNTSGIELLLNAPGDRTPPAMPDRSGRSSRTYFPLKETAPGNAPFTNLPLIPDDLLLRVAKEAPMLGPGTPSVGDVSNLARSAIPIELLKKVPGLLEKLGGIVAAGMGGPEMGGPEMVKQPDERIGGGELLNSMRNLLENPQPKLPDESVVIGPDSDGVYRVKGDQTYLNKSGSFSKAAEGTAERQRKNLGIPSEQETLANDLLQSVIVAAGRSKDPEALANLPQIINAVRMSIAPN